MMETSIQKVAIPDILNTKEETSIGHHHFSFALLQIVFKDIQKVDKKKLTFLEVSTYRLSSLFVQ